MPSAAPLQYLQPDSPQTLRAGIAELRAAEGVDHDAAAQVSPELRHDLDVHDAIHVLFGCPTTLRGEIAAHVWTLCGTTLPLREMHRVAGHADHRAVLRTIGYRKLIRTWFQGFGTIVMTTWRSCRMTHRLEIASLPTMYDRPLSELRAELGIRFPPTKQSSGNRASGESTTTGGAALRHVRRGDWSTGRPSRAVTPVGSFASPHV
jgi:hypothetical protein